MICSVRKGFNQSICRTKGQETRLPCLASAMPKFAMPSGAKMRKVCKEAKRKNLAVLEMLLLWCLCLYLWLLLIVRVNVVSCRVTLEPVKYLFLVRIQSVVCIKNHLLAAKCMCSWVSTFSTTTKSKREHWVSAKTKFLQMTTSRNTS